MGMELEEIKTSLTLSKARIAEFAQSIAGKVEEGEVSALEVQALSKGLEELAKSLKKATAEQAVEEASKYGKGQKITALGCRITPSNSSRYEYRGEAFEQIDEAVRPYEELRKQLKEAAKAAEKNGRPIAVIVTADGEQIEVPSAVSSTTETVSIQLKK